MNDPRPTEEAMRAALKLRNEIQAMNPYIRIQDCDLREMAELIDRETGLPGLIAALTIAKVRGPQ